MVEASRPPSLPPGQVHVVYWSWCANHSSIVVELAVDLAVETVAEGQKIKGKPFGYAGKKRIRTVIIYHQ